MKSDRIAALVVTVAWAWLAAAAPPDAGPAPVAAPAKPGAFGQERIFAFVYQQEQNAKDQKAANFTHSRDWRYWAARGGVAATAKTWFDVLRDTTVEQGAAVLAGLDYGDNPRPVLAIDEFGFDYGGETDQKSAQILRALRARKPQLGIAVYQMRGPAGPALAEAYGLAADLVMIEAYVGSAADYWQIALPLMAAKFGGLERKSIAVLGLGVGGQPGERWAATCAEVEQQVRFARRLAPDAPGMGFYGGDKQPELLACADQLCRRFSELSPDGAGLDAKAREMADAFVGNFQEPVLACSPIYVEPNRGFKNPSDLVQPVTFRVFLLNLGRDEARGVKVRLRNPPEQGGNVFAAGEAARVPGRSSLVAVLPITEPGSPWKVWKTWKLELEAPGCRILVFPRE